MFFQKISKCIQTIAKQLTYLLRCPVDPTSWIATNSRTARQAVLSEKPRPVALILSRSARSVC